MHHVTIAAHDARQLQQLLDYMRSIGVTRVVFPGREYRSQRAGAHRNARTVDPGERTVRNIRWMDDGERETTRLPDREWVREVICGDGPVPSGLDPEMISAARRIARRLWNG